jgi:hypothetical protein
MRIKRLLLLACVLAFVASPDAFGGEKNRLGKGASQSREMVARQGLHWGDQVFTSVGPFKEWWSWHRWNWRHFQARHAPAAAGLEARIVSRLGRGASQSRQMIAGHGLHWGAEVFTSVGLFQVWLSDHRHTWRTFQGAHGPAAAGLEAHASS